jgi:hypothetical protein
MSIQRINEFPEGSGSLSSDDVFLFMDDPSGNKATKKISLSQLSEAIGVIAVSGASADTGDITFNGSTISTANTNQSIILNPNGSGDVNVNDFVFNSNGTVSLPSNTLNAGSYGIDIKSSDYAELWFQSGPSGTFGSYLNNPSRNEASYIWTASEGVFIQNYRPNDGTNPNWNHEWQFDNNGKLQFPDNLAIGNSIISNMIVNSLGEGTYLSTGSQIEVVGAKTVISNGVTNSVSGDGGSSVLTSQNQLEVNSSGVLIGNKVTNTLDGNSITSFNGWTFDATDHNLTLPLGGSLSETNNTVSIAPPTAASGQSLVIRPTAAIWAISSSNYIEYGNPITIVVTLQTWAYFGTVNYTISGPGVTPQSLGRALTGKLTFVSTTGPDAESITWTIPANSSITEFTLTLTSVDGTISTNQETENDPALYYDFEENAMPTGQFITVTNNGISSSEHSHVHLVAGDPSTVDIYLGDDDQYVKIQKNGGDVIVGTQRTLTTNNNYIKSTDFSTDVDLGIGIGIIAGWYQRNASQIEFALFGNSIFQSYLTGLALGRTVIVTYTNGATPSGTATLTATLTQVFSSTGQADPNNPTWSRVSGRIDATLPTVVGELSIVSINFPVYSTDTNNWTFDTDGKLILPGGYAQVVVEGDSGVRIGTAGTNVAPNSQIKIGGAEHAFEIFGGPPGYSWTFDGNGELTLPASGSITFPNNTTQTSAGIPSNTGLVPNSVSITNIVSISQANYDALVTKNSTTLYVIS